MIGTQTRQSYEEKGRLAVIFAAPLLPGKAEAWRRFIQEMTGLRRHDYEASRQRLGITAEWIWLIPAGPQETVVILVKATRPEQVLDRIAASDWPFESWFRQQLLALHGLDLTQSPHLTLSELMLAWHAPAEKASLY